MQPRFLVRAAIALGATTIIVLLVLSAYRPVDAAAVLTAGKADLKSAGALTFGPDGVLFVGDSIGGAVVALDTNDRTPVKTAAINVQGLDQKIAQVLAFPLFGRLFRRGGVRRHEVWITRMSDTGMQTS